MANTLNLGNGNWATKEDSLLAYNSENGNFKPLPFDFTRASSATVVNKAGLIETVGGGEPRIDFSDDAKGALLLEPQRSNYQPYSNDFSVWSAADVTVNSSYGLSPDGLNNSSLITEGTGSAQHRIVKGSPSSSGIYTFSCFVKNKVGNHQAYIDMGAVTGFFNFDTKTMYSAAGTTNVESWSNNWYRVSITSSSNVTPSANYIGIGKNNTETFQGDGSSAIEFFGAQLEQGSYPTSYIPTQGSAVTRVADVCNQTPPSGIIGQTEGTLFVDVDFKTLSGTNMFVSIRPDASNKIEIYRSDAIIYAEFTSLSNSFNFNKPNVTVGRYKIAVAYSSGSSAMYINGVFIGSNTTSISFSSTLDDIYINSRGTTFIEQSSYKDLKLYNTRLSNSELQALTTI